MTEPVRLSRSGVARLATVLLGGVLVAAVYFVAAGTLDRWRAWLYYGGTLGYQVVVVSVMLLRFPGVVELVNERGKVLRRDVKRWDKAFAVAYTVLLLALPAVAGLDGGRRHGPEAPAALAAPALCVTILAYAFVHWAMIVNRHAETGVRIQEDRHHEVVSAGPYRLIRHPFYVSLIVMQLVYPLAVGSLLAYLPALAIAGLFVWRTAREDATLQAELPGYAEYAARVRRRLLPGVW
jgi:protein-S-isoprenylcysteine O-methyltransferase Ste14